MSNVITVLQDAKKYVEKGWTRGRIYRREGNQHTYCALGAIHRAAGAGVRAEYLWGNGKYDSHASEVAQEFLKKAIAKVRRQSVDKVDVASWNDWHGRKQEDVVKIFDRAIEIAEKEAAKS